MLLWSRADTGTAVKLVREFLAKLPNKITGPVEWTREPARNCWTTPTKQEEDFAFNGYPPKGIMISFDLLWLFLSYLYLEIRGHDNLRPTPFVTLLELLTTALSRQTTSMASGDHHFIAMQWDDLIEKTDRGSKDTLVRVQNLMMLAYEEMSEAEEEGQHVLIAEVAREFIDECNVQSFEVITADTLLESLWVILSLYSTLQMTSSCVFL
jgi:hypothetical protein